MSDVTEDTAKSSTEFDFALAGHASTRLSSSPAIQLIHSLREVKQELEAVTPGQLARQFVSSTYAESSQGGAGTLGDLPEAEDTGNFGVGEPPPDEVTLEPVPVSPDFIITVETEISKIDLARPKSAPSISAAEAISELSRFEAPDKIGPSLPLGDSVDVNSEPHGEDLDILVQDDTIIENILVPEQQLSPVEVPVEQDSEVFKGERSILIPREKDSTVDPILWPQPESEPTAIRPKSVVNLVKPAGPASDHQPQPNSLAPLATPFARPKPDTKPEPTKPTEIPSSPSNPAVVNAAASPMASQGSTTSTRRNTRFDSRFALLLVGLVTLVAFVVLCVWLIVNTASEPTSGQSTSRVDVVDFVPSESLIVAPGVLQAEDYDNDGVGVSFQDSDDANSGGVYRDDGVDIVAVPGQDVKLAVVDTTGGEWLTYSFTVDEPGVFVVTTGVSSSIDEPGSLDVSVDGNRIGTFYGERSLTEFDFTKQVVGEVELSPGKHQIRLDWSGNGGISVDWLEIGRS